MKKNFKEGKQIEEGREDKERKIGKNKSKSLALAILESQRQPVAAILPISSFSSPSFPSSSTPSEDELKDGKSIPQNQNFSRLPVEILRFMGTYLQVFEIPNVLLVCKHWKSINDQLYSLNLLTRLQIKIEERIIIDGYADQLFSVFNHTETKAKITSALELKGIEEEDEDDDESDVATKFTENLEYEICSFFHRVPEEFQIKLIQKFFEKYPKFNIRTCTTLIGKESLPILLYDWDQQLALNYILKNYQYDSDCFYGENTLNLVKERPSIFSKKEKSILESKNSSKLSVMPLLKAGAFVETAVTSHNNL